MGSQVPGRATCAYGLIDYAILVEAARAAIHVIFCGRTSEIRTILKSESVATKHDEIKIASVVGGRLKCIAGDRHIKALNVRPDASRPARHINILTGIDQESRQR